MCIKILVRFKDDVQNPDEAVKRAEISAQYRGVSRVRCAKYFEVALATENRDEALALAREVAEKLLINPVYEEYVVIDESGA